MPVIARRPQAGISAKDAEQDARLAAIEATLDAILKAVEDEDEEDEPANDLDGNPVPKPRGEHEPL